LILRGARQVGKSTLVRNWCQDQGLELLEFNLEKEPFRSLILHPRQRVSLQDQPPTLSSLLDEIQLRKNTRIGPKTLIFFDEIQEQPELIQFLRYFYEERPDLAVISAGSLLEIVLKTEAISFPVGRVEFLHLGPMNFGEFLIATGRDLLAEALAQGQRSESSHELARRAFREFLYVGGMPEAVASFVEEKSLAPVRMIQDQILQTYLADFPKYNSRIASSRIQEVFRSSAAQVGKKVIYQRLATEAQSRDIKRVVELLIDARVLLVAYHSDGRSVPLAGQIDRSVFKLYFLDVGLMNAMMRIDLETIDLEMKNQFNTKGVVAEQFVAQHLNGIRGDRLEPELFYWLRDKGAQKGEVDFLLHDTAGVLPVEVKSGAPGKLKSLFYFSKERAHSRAVRLSLAQASEERVQHRINDSVVSIRLKNVPIYAVQWLLGP
jgi:hypothetical protein